MIITNRPQLWIVSGVNGAGKTSFTSKYFRGKIPIVNPDEIALQNNIQPIEAGKKTLLLREHLLSNNISFVIETTLSGINEFNFIKKCKQKGYKINFIYIYLSSINLSYARVQQRVQNNGHDIDIQDINRRYSRSIDNFRKIEQISNRTWLLDNSNSKTKLVYSSIDKNTKFLSKDIHSKLKKYFNL
jgi:predicted ABC-type ATPase